MTLWEFFIGTRDKPQAPAITPEAHEVERALSQREVATAVDELGALVLPGLGQERGVFDELLGGFTAYVMDLPASQRHHHSRTWGLLVHSIQVATSAVRHVGQRIQGSDPNHSQWLYADFMLGLTHDIGKVVDVRVSAPDGTAWDPFAETLASFYSKHPKNVSYKHRDGRTSLDHVALGSIFLSRIITENVSTFLRPILVEVLAGESEAARQLAKDVKRADSESVKADMASRRPPPRKETRELDPDF